MSAFALQKDLRSFICGISGPNPVLIKCFRLPAFFISILTLKDSKLFINKIKGQRKGKEIIKSVL